jgi:hypothetical protein
MAEDVAIEVHLEVVEEECRSDSRARLRWSCYEASIFEVECVLLVSVDGLTVMLAETNRQRAAASRLRLTTAAVR